MYAAVHPQRTAVELLYELAAELRVLPIRPATLRLHLRALELKRRVRDWDHDPPDRAAVDDVIEDVDRLRAEVRDALSENRAPPRPQTMTYRRPRLSASSG